MKQMMSSNGFKGFDHYLLASMNYSEYLALVERLAEEGKTTGPVQSEDLALFTRLNRQRMSRLNKTVSVEDEYLQTLTALKRPVFWLVINEAWCGDAAQSVPVIEKFVAASDLIESGHVLRDENPELMSRYLSNGAKSIPKLVALDRATLQELGVWGSRPEALRNFFAELKSKGVEKPELSEAVQRWYLKDKQEQIKIEISGFIKRIAEMQNGIQGNN